MAFSRTWPLWPLWAIRFFPVGSVALLLLAPSAREGCRPDLAGGCLVGGLTPGFSGLAYGAWNEASGVSLGLGFKFGADGLPKDASLLGPKTARMKI